VSLATRCAACGTVFRVVQDQLKVSEGWVRCGRCGEVFSALEGLFDLEREAAPVWTPSQQASLGLEPVSADERATQTGRAAAGSARHVGSMGDRESAVVSESPDDSEFDSRSDSQVEARELRHGDFDDDAVGRGEASDFVDDPLAHDLGPTSLSPEPTPLFMRRADSSNRWQRPGVRRVLAGSAMVLGLLLVTQAAMLQRDVIAARWPQGLPLLTMLCQPLGCSIAPLRRLDGLLVDSSGLSQLDNPSLYRLQVSLRNRDSVALATPSMDLTLTDGRGDILARRVLGQGEFANPAPAVVAAGSELLLEAVLDAGDKRISGYSIEIFYP